MSEVKHPDKDSLILLDADYLVYSLGFGLEKEPLHVVERVLDYKVQSLKKELGTYNMKCYLSGSTNFRDEVAITHKYKGNREDFKKPKWYKEIRDYFYYMHDTEVSENCEADDKIAMKMTINPHTICVSADKDLWQVPGWHFTPKTKRLPGYPLRYIDEFGFLELKNNNKKLVGGGLMFLYSQALTGDKVDNIHGLDKYGPVKAYNTLKDCTNHKELHETVLDQYLNHVAWPESQLARERFEENMKLLYLCRSVDGEGNPVQWENPYE